MPEYEYEDLLGGDAAPPMENPLDRALRTIQSLMAPAQSPDAVVGSELVQPVIPEPPGVRVPDRLASEGLSVGAGAVPPGPARPAEIPVDPATLSPGIQAGLGEDVDQEDPSRNRYKAPYQAKTVAEATDQVADQTARLAKTREDWAAKKMAAEKLRSDALVVAAEDEVQETILNNTRHERTMAMVNARADAETATMLTNLANLAKQEPNPGRWWENQSGLGKALWGLSLVFGAGYAALTPGARNAALDMVRQEISNDVAMQDARLKREMAVEQLKFSTSREKQARNRSDVLGKYERELSRIQALKRAWDARAVAPNDLDAQAGKLESQAWFDEMTLNRTVAHRGELVAAGQAEANRQFQRQMQASSQAHASRLAQAELDARKEEKRLDREQALKLAQISASVKTGARVDAKGRPVDESGIPVLREAQSGVGTNVVVKDPLTKGLAQSPFGAGPGVAVFRDDKDRRSFEETKNRADERYKTMVDLKAALERQSTLAKTGGLAAGTIDPEVERLLKKVGYENAKQFDPRITNQDFANGLAIATGFNPDGNLLEKAKFFANYDKIVEMVGKEIAEMPGHVSGALTKDLDKSIQGDAEVLWTPTDLNAPKVRERSENELTGRPGVSLQERPVQGTQDYLTRQKAEADPAKVGQELPDHEPDKVEAVIAAGKGRGPDAVTKQAQKVLTELDARASALTEGKNLLQEGAALPPVAEAELRRINATRDIVKAVAFDESERARKTLEKFEKWARSTPFLSDDVKRELAKKPRFGLTAAPKDVEEALKRAKTKPPTALDIITSED